MIDKPKTRRVTDPPQMHPLFGDKRRRPNTSLIVLISLNFGRTSDVFRPDFRTVPAMSGFVRCMEHRSPPEMYRPASTPRPLELQAQVAPLTWLVARFRAWRRHSTERGYLVNSDHRLRLDLLAAGQEFAGEISKPFWRSGARHSLARARTWKRIPDTGWVEVTRSPRLSPSLPSGTSRKREDHV